MSGKSAHCHPKSSWDGLKNARLTLNNGKRERKSVCSLENDLAPVVAKQCSPPPSNRICQLFSQTNLRLNAPFSKYDDRPRTTCRDSIKADGHRSSRQNNAIAIRDLACALLRVRYPLMAHRMIDQEKFARLAPLAFQWAKTQEDVILKYGAALAPGQITDALRCGVHDPARVRVLVVDRIPLPDDEELAEAARRAQIITEASVMGLSSGRMVGRTVNCSCINLCTSRNVNAAAGWSHLWGNIYAIAAPARTSVSGHSKSLVCLGMNPTFRLRAEVRCPFASYSVRILHLLAGTIAAQD